MYYDMMQHIIILPKSLSIINFTGRFLFALISLRIEDKHWLKFVTLLAVLSLWGDDGSTFYCFYFRHTYPFTFLF